MENEFRNIISDAKYKQLKKVIEFGYIIRTNLETLSIIKKGTIDGMGGYCALGSLLLHNASKCADINTNFVLGTFHKNPLSKSGHCWVQFEQVIVDITASQFNINKRIFVSVIDDNRYRPFYRNKHAVTMVEKGWPTDQKPSTYFNDLKIISEKINLTVERTQQTK